MALLRPYFEDEWSIRRMASLERAEFAPFSNLRSVHVEEERDRDHHGTKKAEQGHRPGQSEVRELEC